MGRFQNDEITNDFITNAVMSASKLTSLGEGNGLSQITSPGPFPQTGASVRPHVHKEKGRCLFPSAIVSTVSQPRDSSYVRSDTCVHVCVCLSVLCSRRFYLLDALCTATTTSFDNEKCPQTWPDVRWEAELPDTEPGAPQKGGYLYQQWP